MAFWVMMLNQISTWLIQEDRSFRPERLSAPPPTESPDRLSGYTAFRQRAAAAALRRIRPAADPEPDARVFGLRSGRSVSNRIGAMCGAVAKFYRRWNHPQTRYPARPCVRARELAPTRAALHRKRAAGVSWVRGRRRVRRPRRPPKRGARCPGAIPRVPAHRRPRPSLCRSRGRGETKPAWILGFRRVASPKLYVQIPQAVRSGDYRVRRSMVGGCDQPAAPPVRGAGGLRQYPDAGQVRPRGVLHSAPSVPRRQQPGCRESHPLVGPVRRTEPRGCPDDQASRTRPRSPDVLDNLHRSANRGRTGPPRKPHNNCGVLQRYTNGSVTQGVSGA